MMKRVEKTSSDITAASVERILESIVVVSLLVFELYDFTLSYFLSMVPLHYFCCHQES